MLRKKRYLSKQWKFRHPMDTQRSIVAQEASADEHSLLINYCEFWAIKEHLVSLLNSNNISASDLMLPSSHPYCVNSELLSRMCADLALF